MDSQDARHSPHAIQQEPCAQSPANPRRGFFAFEYEANPQCRLHASGCLSSLTCPVGCPWLCPTSFSTPSRRPSPAEPKLVALPCLPYASTAGKNDVYIKLCCFTSGNLCMRMMLQLGESQRLSVTRDTRPAVVRGVGPALCGTAMLSYMRTKPAIYYTSVPCVLPGRAAAPISTLTVSPSGQPVDATTRYHQW
jgi:hypothetical protein